MRSHALLPLLALPLLTLFTIHCSGPSTDPPPPQPPPIDDAGPPKTDDVPLVPASKIDLLFAIDNSASMGDKQLVLASSASALLRRLAPKYDLHVGFVSSSLASGGDVCAATGRTNDMGHLLTQVKGGGDLGSAKNGFLSFPKGGDVEQLVKDAEQLVVGVRQTGCGLEAQLESAYRFLVQPDPWGSIEIGADNKAKLIGVDDTLLKQRKAFLRPDSAVGIVMITDEDDSAVDPVALGGRGHWFARSQFPSSPTFRADGKTTTAAHRTAACDEDLFDPACTSCAFTGDSSCTFYGPTEDPLNVRFFHMKERFGADPQFPISRYVDGLTNRRVPDRTTEHDAAGNYVGTPSCTNPLFAAVLPDGANQELCKLPEGTRSNRLVFFTIIGGVPEPLTRNGRPSSEDWVKILGKDPAKLDRSGIDPHMIQSTTPRAGLPLPAGRGDNGTDAIHGREWDTGGNDLQYACTFALPIARRCTAMETSCDCADSVTTPPLCSSTLGEQLRAKAYPTIRELEVAKGLGDRAVVGSICAIDADGRYAATMNAIADRMIPVLTP